MGKLGVCVGVRPSSEPADHPLPFRDSSSGVCLWLTLAICKIEVAAEERPHGAVGISLGAQWLGTADK